MRSIPNITVIDPCDATKVAQATQVIADHEGPVCMRLLRGVVPVILDAKIHQFEIGRTKLLRDGTDAVIISTGFITAERSSRRPSLLVRACGSR